MAKKKAYNVDMESPALVAIGFVDPEDALKFIGACGCLTTMDPEEIDANDLILTLRRSAKTFGIYTKDPEVLKQATEKVIKEKKTEQDL